MIKRSAIALFGAAGILLVGAVTTVAAPGDKGARLDKMIERIDADQSGAISFEEFSSRSNSRFDKSDTDGNGVVTAEEREDAKAAFMAERDDQKKQRKGKMEKRAEKRLARIDTNSDGDISRAEHDAHQQERFANLDADGDGQVSKTEFSDGFKNRRGGRKGERG